MTASYLEASFALWLRQTGLHAPIPDPETEYRFAPPRRWRLDFAWPQWLVAVEIEGLTPTGGRHQRVGGFLADAEKYEAALHLGWAVYRVPGQWVATSGAARPSRLATPGHGGAGGHTGGPRVGWRSRMRVGGLVDTKTRYALLWVCSRRTP